MRWYAATVDGGQGRPKVARASRRAQRSARSKSSRVWSMSKRTARRRGRRRLLGAVGDQPALEVVRRDAHGHAVPLDHADPVLAHLPVQAGEHLVLVADLDLVVAA